jgi:Spx/MgsR family transcriptional regulator
VIHGIKACDTMKKARAWLDANGIAYVFNDYKTAGIEQATLERWADEVGWEKLLNRAGTTFRALNEAETANLDRPKAIALMLSKPSLIKRPVLDADGRRVVGFSPASYAEVFTR